MATAHDEVWVCEEREEKESVGSAFPSLAIFGL